MAFFISRQEVANNLLRFKKNVGSTPPVSPTEKRIYKAIMNYRTGDIQFSQPESELAEWKEIQIEAKPKKKGSTSFEANDTDRHPLNSAEMAPMAWKVMIETLEILNEMIAEYQNTPGILPEYAAFDHLSEQELQVSNTIESIPGWIGEIDRMSAEKKLALQPVGAYLLRNGDSLTEAIAARLSESNQMRVELFICTVVEPEDKISDILILATNIGWTLYRDNPDLKDTEYQYHRSPGKLFTLLSPRLKHPVSEGYA